MARKSETIPRKQVYPTDVTVEDGEERRVVPEERGGGWGLIVAARAASERSLDVVTITEGVLV